MSIKQWDAVFLPANGTINNEALNMFGYQAHHEMSTLERHSPRTSSA
jgi:hypothetical protein